MPIVLKNGWRKIIGLSYKVADGFICFGCPLALVFRFLISALYDQRNWNARIATNVGGNAATNSPKGWIESSSNDSLSMAKPAGLGALAMTVRPPPVTAPATREYWNSGLVPSSKEPRYVSAALSVNAVRNVAP